MCNHLFLCFFPVDTVGAVFSVFGTAYNIYLFFKSSAKYDNCLYIIHVLVYMYMSTHKYRYTLYSSLSLSYFSYAEDYSTTSISNTILNTSSNSSTSDPAGGRNSNRSFVQLYLPLLPMFLLILVFSVWGMYSPSDVLEKDPRAFMLTIGMVFSNIAVSGTSSLF